jgi:glycosyltransferase involved in cell wall biosynthesis
LNSAREKKKIVHIAKVTGIHGMEKHLLTLLPGLSSEEYEIIFLILVEPHKSVSAYCRLLEKNNVIFHTIPIRADIDILCFWRIVQYVRTLRPALVHTHLIHGDVYGITAAKLAGSAHIISTKHNDDDFRTRGPIKMLNQVLGRQVTHIITISNWLHEFASTVELIPPEKLTTIFYGLALPQVSRDRDLVRSQLGCASQDILLGIIARLVEQKGHRYLLDAFARALQEYQNLRLLIVGSGELEEKLKQQVKEAQLTNRVMFTGYQADVYDLLNAFDIFIHPSLWEGFGLSVLEAMAMGKPVIATQVSAIPELVEDGVTGFLVQPRDTAALSAMILKLARDPSLQKQLGEKGRERWKTFFSVERMVQATKTVYAKVLAG